MSSPAVVKKKNELALQLLKYLQQQNIQDTSIDQLHKAIHTAPDQVDTMVLASQVITKYKEHFNNEMAAVFKRWVLLN